MLNRRTFLKKSGAVVITGTVATSLIGCGDNKDALAPKKGFNGKVALLADVHFHDIYGDYDFKGNDVTIRTMQDSVESTRMFNENYFVFIATLDEVVESGIKYVILPGDFSDEGQVDTIKTLKRIINDYQSKYGLEFFLTTGNHDPNDPFGSNESKRFLNANGSATKVTSNPDDEANFVPSINEVDIVITQKMAGLGFEDLMSEFSDCGFYPLDSYLHYETPWGSNDFSKRGYMAVSSSGNNVWCPDTSYLAEPTEDLWLCSVDMNVHIPRDDGSWSHASKGWEEGKDRKPEVMKWLKSVTQRAEELGKTLIVFSHYPAVEYLNYSAKDFYYLFADGSYNNSRIPSSSTSDAVREAGVKLQFAGHIHVNDTAKYSTPDGRILYNIQSPSLAAYIPAYKVITCTDIDIFEIETKAVNDVPNFDSLFDYYKKEAEYRKANGLPVEWEDMLTAKSYHEFMYLHLNNLTLIEKYTSWGQDMQIMYRDKISLYWIMVLSQLETNLRSEQLVSFFDATKNMTEVELVKLLSSMTAEGEVTIAMNLCDAKITEENLDKNKFFTLTFMDLCNGILHIRNGDELAILDLGYETLGIIKATTDMMRYLDADGDLGNYQSYDYFLGDAANGSSISITDMDLELIKTRFAALARIFYKFEISEPSTHFRIDTSKGTIKNLWDKNPYR